MRKITSLAIVSALALLAVGTWSAMQRPAPRSGSERLEAMVGRSPVQVLTHPKNAPPVYEAAQPF